MAAFPTYAVIGKNDTGTTGQDLATFNGSSHTPGAWVELTASSPFDAVGIWVDVTGTASSGRPYMIDIGVGAAASEVVVVPSVYIQHTLREASGIMIPVAIPAGSRISARAQVNNSTTRTITASARLVSVCDNIPWEVASTVQTYGVNAGSTQMTPCDPGGVADTLVWTELSASTSHRIRQLSFVVAMTGVNQALSDARFRISIGTGGSGSEVAVIPDVFVFASALADHVVPAAHGPFQVDIPSGTRLVAGVRSSNIDASDRLIDVGVWANADGGVTLSGGSAMPVIGAGGLVF